MIFERFPGGARVERTGEVGLTCWSVPTKQLTTADSKQLKADNQTGKQPIADWRTERNANEGKSQLPTCDLSD